MMSVVRGIVPQFHGPRCFLLKTVRRGSSLLVLLILAFAAGCVSTSQQTSIREATECTPEGCPPHDYKLDLVLPAKKGPAAGAAAVDFILAYLSDDDDRVDVDAEMKKKGYVCGPACRQIDHATMDLYLKLIPVQNSNGEETCGSLPVTEKRILPTSPSLTQAALLYVGRGSILDSTLKAWNELCDQKFPGCVLGGAVASGSDEKKFMKEYKNPVNKTETVYELSMVITCVKESEDTRQLEISGKGTFYRKCEPPPPGQCSAVSRPSDGSF